MMLYRRISIAYGYILTCFLIANRSCETAMDTSSTTITETDSTSPSSSSTITQTTASFQQSTTPVSSPKSSTALQNTTALPITTPLNVPATEQLSGSKPDTQTNLQTTVDELLAPITTTPVVSSTAETSSAIPSIQPAPVASSDSSQPTVNSSPVSPFQTQTPVSQQTDTSTGIAITDFVTTSPQLLITALLLTPNLTGTETPTVTMNDEVPMTTSNTKNTLTTPIATGAIRIQSLATVPHAIGETLTTSNGSNGTLTLSHGTGETLTTSLASHGSNATLTPYVGTGEPLISLYGTGKTLITPQATSDTPTSPYVIREALTSSHAIGESLAPPNVTGESHVTVESAITLHATGESYAPLNATDVSHTSSHVTFGPITTLNATGATPHAIGESPATSHVESLATSHATSEAVHLANDTPPVTPPPNSVAHTANIISTPSISRQTISPYAHSGSNLSSNITVLSDVLFTSHTDTITEPSTITHLQTLSLENVTSSHMTSSMNKQLTSHPIQQPVSLANMSTETAIQTTITQSHLQNDVSVPHTIPNNNTSTSAVDTQINISPPAINSTINSTAINNMPTTTTTSQTEPLTTNRSNSSPATTIDPNVSFTNSQSNTIPAVNSYQTASSFTNQLSPNSSTTSSSGDNITSTNSPETINSSENITPTRNFILTGVPEYGRNQTESILTHQFLTTSTSAYSSPSTINEFKNSTTINSPLTTISVISSNTSSPLVLNQLSSHLPSTTSLLTNITTTNSLPITFSELSSNETVSLTTNQFIIPATFPATTNITTTNSTPTPEPELSGSHTVSSTSDQIIIPTTLPSAANITTTNSAPTTVPELRSNQTVSSTTNQFFIPVTLPATANNISINSTPTTVPQLSGNQTVTITTNALIITASLPATINSSTNVATATSIQTTANIYSSQTARMSTNQSTVTNDTVVSQEISTTPRSPTRSLEVLSPATTNTFANTEFISAIRTSTKLNPSTNTAGILIHSTTTTTTTVTPFCLSNPCKNGGRCVEGNTSHPCECIAGYMGITCEETFMCDFYPCYPFGTCKYSATSNGYQCSCNPGFKQINNTYCEDIDECQQTPNICSNGKCTNMVGSYKCSCPLGKYGHDCNQDTPTYASFTSISRSMGPLAGGTWLTLSGVNLENFSAVGAYFVPATSGYETLYGLAGKSEGGSPSNSIAIVTPKAPNASYTHVKFQLEVEYFGPPYHIIMTTELYFQYVDNPVISDIQPRQQQATGGMRLTVTGQNLDAISKPIMHVTTILEQPSTHTANVEEHFQNCSVTSATQMICVLPLLPVDSVLQTPSNPARRRRRSSETGSGVHSEPWSSTDVISQDNTSPGKLSKRHRRAPAAYLSSDKGSMLVDLGFILDGYPNYINISKSLPSLNLTLVTTLPTLTTQSAVQSYDPGTHGSITIQGTGLNLGCSQEDYQVSIGQGSCRVLSLTEVQLECLPPENKPVRGNESTKHNCPDDSLAVQVQLGEVRNYFVSCIKYASSSSFDRDALIIGLVVGIGGFLILLTIIIIICFVCRRKRKRKQERDRKWQMGMQEAYEKRHEPDGNAFEGMPQSDGSVDSLDDGELVGGINQAKRTTYFQPDQDDGTKGRNGIVNSAFDGGSLQKNTHASFVEELNPKMVSTPSSPGSKGSQERLNMIPLRPFPGKFVRPDNTKGATKTNQPSYVSYDRQMSPELISYDKNRFIEKPKSNVRGTNQPPNKVAQLAVSKPKQNQVVKVAPTPRNTRDMKPHVGERVPSKHLGSIHESDFEDVFFSLDHSKNSAKKSRNPGRKTIILDNEDPFNHDFSYSSTGTFNKNNYSSSSPQNMSPRSRQEPRLNAHPSSSSPQSTSPRSRQEPSLNSSPNQDNPRRFANNRQQLPVGQNIPVVRENYIPSNHYQLVIPDPQKSNDRNTTTFKSNDGRNPTYQSNDVRNPTYRSNDGRNPTYQSNDGRNPTYQSNDGRNPTYRSNDGRNPPNKSNDIRNLNISSIYVESENPYSGSASQFKPSQQPNVPTNNNIKTIYIPPNDTTTITRMFPAPSEVIRSNRDTIVIKNLPSSPTVDAQSRLRIDDTRTLYPK